MARTALTSGAQSSVPATGKNVTDMTVDTLATGADNGVEVPYVQGSHLLLRNDTSGPAEGRHNTDIPFPFSPLTFNLT